MASVSGRSSGIFSVKQTNKIPIRDMNKAFKNRTPESKIVEIKVKLNPKKELFNRLKLLDSIGKANPESNIGSIRSGYMPKVNKSFDPIRENTIPNDNYFEQEDSIMQSFDSSSTSKFRKNFNGLFSINPIELNSALPASLEPELNSKKIQDYTSISTSISSNDK